jgi:UDP:flavonoid glycosyltransferase YjiC (YdhE family)
MTKGNILFITFPAIGHLLPDIGAIKYLQKEGYSITVVCESGFLPVFQKLNIDTIPIDITIDVKIADTKNPLKIIIILRRMLKYEKKMAELVDKILNNGNYDGIAFDLLQSRCGITARRYKIKRFIVYPIIFPFRKGTEPPYNLRYNLPKFLYKIVNKLQLNFFRFLSLFLIGSYKKYKIRSRDTFTDTFIDHHKIILTSPREFNYFIKKPLKNMVFLDYIPDDSLIFDGDIKIEGNGKKVVLISLGTVFNNSKRVKNILKKINLDSKKYRIYVIGVDNLKKEGINFIKNAPLTKLLPKADIFITHGGINSLITAYKYKVKTIIFPQAAEQYENRNVFKYLTEEI